MDECFLQATIDHSTEGSMRVHQIVTFRPPKGCGCDALLEADYYPYSKCHVPGTAGKILPEGTKVGHMFYTQIRIVTMLVLGVKS